MLDFLDNPFHHLNQIQFQPDSLGKSSSFPALPQPQGEIAAKSSLLAPLSFIVKCSFITSRGTCGQVSNRWYSAQASPGLLPGAAVGAQVTSASNLLPSLPRSPRALIFPDLLTPRRLGLLPCT